MTKEKNNLGLSLCTMPQSPVTGLVMYFGIVEYCLCYESPKKELTSHVFEHLIYNLKSYNGVEI